MVDDKMDRQMAELLDQTGIGMTFRQGQMIYMEGDPADRIYYIRKGRVRVFQNISSGREVTIDVVESGHILGESAFGGGRTRPTCVQAVNQVQLVSCRVRDLLPHFQREPQFALYLLKLCSDTMDRLTQRLHDQCLLDRYGKVANFILDVTSSDSEEKGTMGGVLPYTHENLADSLGLSRTTVTMVLKRFEAEGWLQSGYKYVKVLDRPALAKFVEEQKEQ